MANDVVRDARSRQRLLASAALLALGVVLGACAPEVEYPIDGEGGGGGNLGLSNQCVELEATAERVLSSCVGCHEATRPSIQGMLDNGQLVPGSSASSPAMGQLANMPPNNPTSAEDVSAVTAWVDGCSGNYGGVQQVDCSALLATTENTLSGCVGCHATRLNVPGMILNGQLVPGDSGASPTMARLGGMPPNNPTSPENVLAVTQWVNFCAPDYAVAVQQRCSELTTVAESVFSSCGGCHEATRPSIAAMLQNGQLLPGNAAGSPTMAQLANMPPNNPTPADQVAAATDWVNFCAVGY